MSNHLNNRPFVDLAATHAPLRERLLEACARVIDSGRFLGGEQVAAFERELAESCGCKYAVAVSNGLDALRLILRAWVELGMLKKGDEVIAPANTYIASILAISDAGLTPVPVEPDPATFCLDPGKIEAAITPRTKAIMEVHLYGHPCAHSAISGIARSHGLLIIEDNAQAIGASEGDIPTGGMGDAAAFSFYPTKTSAPWAMPEPSPPILQKWPGRCAPWPTMALTIAITICTKVLTAAWMSFRPPCSG